MRFAGYSDRGSTPVGVVVLTAAAAALVTFGATLGGSLVYDYGFNVETAGDHPVWHQNEVDVMPGRNPLVPSNSAGNPVSPRRAAERSAARRGETKEKSSDLDSF